MSALDSLIEYVSPTWAFKRKSYREALAAYESAAPGRLRKTRPDNGSGDAVVGKAGNVIRGYARQLEQNYDIANGVLATLVNNVVGPNGIGVEFQPKTPDGEIHEDFAKELLEAHKDWRLRPEVTWEHDWSSAERLACRTWLRDGEMLTQLLLGNVPALDHGTRVPFSVEMIEADLMPFDYTDEKLGITQGVERNAWGRPTGYHIFKHHPGDSGMHTFNMTTKRVPAERMLHLKLANRIRQARGVSVFASVIRRLEDIKDYEESERVAARIAAALAGYIKKGQPSDYTPPTSDDTDRLFSLKPGIIFDTLRPGEDVGTIQSDRPSSLASPFIELMLRGVASGSYTNFSSIAKNYNGTWSAQRQELVEGWGNYLSLTMLFVGMFSRPIAHKFIDAAIMSRQIKIPKDIDPLTLYDADYIGPTMPWIDPEKEVKANERLELAGYKSAQSIIRSTGQNPEAVRKQIKSWRDKNDKDGLIFSTDKKHDIQEKQDVQEKQDIQEEEEGNDLQDQSEG